jgi:hypothetical protein
MTPGDVVSSDGDSVGWPHDGQNRPRAWSSDAHEGQRIGEIAKILNDWPFFSGLPTDASSLHKFLERATPSSVRNERGIKGRCPARVLPRQPYDHDGSADLPRKRLDGGNVTTVIGDLRHDRS